MASTGECDDRFKKTARAFRTTIPKTSENLVTGKHIPEVHAVSLCYPPDALTESKMKYLRRYKSFIHEARIICHEATSSANDLYDSLIPRGCIVQFLHVEYSLDTTSSTVNLRDLFGRVSSVHIKVKEIREDDVFRAVSTVRDSEDFGVRISGWHNLDDKYVEFVLEALKSEKRRLGNHSTKFSYEVARGYLIFWSEESYQSVENSTLGKYIPEDSSRPSKTSLEGEIPLDST